MIIMKSFVCLIWVTAALVLIGGARTIIEITNRDEAISITPEQRAEMKKSFNRVLEQLEHDLKVKTKRRSKMKTTNTYEIIDTLGE